jgi:(p)ppGpp synthase/HD superfamily hydrolase
MSTLEEAIVLAAKAHAGAKDKAGAPYILHPLRVMLRLHDDVERMVAVLHDVVEDTDWTLEGLLEAGFSETVVRAVERLTRRPEEPYDAFIRRAAEDPLSLRVKVADLEDNLDLTRLTRPTRRNQERLAKYREALRYLKGVEGQGNVPGNPHSP